MSSNKPVVKVSGLLKTGRIVPASAAEASGLPDFPQVKPRSGPDASQIAKAQEPPSVLVTSPPACMIPLSKLKIHPFNSRTQRTQERIEEVRDMLEAEGIQREPITVVPGRRSDDNGYFYILSGQTRYHAANLAGWTELKAQINSAIDPDDHVAFFAASIEHNTSRPETDWDLAVKAKLLNEEGVETAKIQRAVRRDARGFRRLMAMVDLPESVLVVVRDNAGKMSSAFCEVLRSGLSELGEETLASIAKQVVEEDLSRRALEQVINRTMRTKDRNGQGAKRATREFMLPVVIGGDTKAGEFKVMQSRKVEGNRVIDLSVDLPEHLAEVLKTDIEAALSKIKRDGREN